MRRCLVLLTLLLSTSASAAPAVTAAEAEEVRLTEEMRALARRNIWIGVDRMYRALVALDADLTGKQHIEGAYAAQDLGEIQACYDRLRAAARSTPTREVIDWLWAIDTQYGQVEVTAQLGAQLATDEPPLDAVKRKAIETASLHLSEGGQFVGMLPVGEYLVGGAVLTVTSGQRAALAL